MILTKHALTVEANCPVDDSLDVYAVTVETHRQIDVETILSAVAHIVAYGGPVYQEDITRRLSTALQATVITVGEHSGVTTTCRAEW